MSGGTGLNRGKSASREDAYQLSICGRIAEFQAQRPPMQIAATPRTTASTFSEAKRMSIRPLPRKGLRGRLRPSTGSGSLASGWDRLNRRTSTPRPDNAKTSAPSTRAPTIPCGRNANQAPRPTTTATSQPANRIEAKSGRREGSTSTADPWSTAPHRRQKSACGQFPVRATRTDELADRGGVGAPAARPPPSAQVVHIRDLARGAVPARPSSPRATHPASSH